MNKDLISVIVPVYNAENYLYRCVESICKQTYSYFELLLVNDGSKDNSLKLCKELEEQDNRIVVFDRPNGGVSAARNTGLEHKRGQYVVFIDSDDFVSPNYLENLYLAIKQNSYDIVQCNFERTSKLDVFPATVEYRQDDVIEITKEQALNERKYKVVVWNKIYSSQILEGFLFQEGIIHEDDASYYIFVDRADRIAVLNESLYFYYLSPNSITRNQQINKRMDYIGIYENRIQYFKERNNQELLEGSYGRFCLVLLLNLSGSYANGNNVKDRKLQLKLFRKYYLLAMKSKAIKLKDKLLFSGFNLCPHLIGIIIGKIRK